MFDNLSERLERSFKILKGEGKITEINVAETLKDVRKALLDADVNYKVAKNFTDTVKEKALGQNVLTAVKPSQLMVKIVHDELTQLMGGETSEINLDSKPAIILMSGLQGSGKTTFSGKLARMLKSKKNKKPLLVACDVYRPAAIDQLQTVSQQANIVFCPPFGFWVKRRGGNLPPHPCGYGVYWSKSGYSSSWAKSSSVIAQSFVRALSVSSLSSVSSGESSPRISRRLSISPVRLPVL
jgi:hypothetical protein